LSWGELSELRGFQARAGTLTLLLLAGGDDPDALREALARLDAELFDPDFDPDADERYAGDDLLDLAIPAGGLRELPYVARVLATWLGESPTGPLRIREEEGLLAIGALAAGWSSTVVHALSGAALTIEELQEATGAVNREALEARVAALEDAGLVELLEGPAGEVRYAPTPWLRRGAAPLGAAARNECRLHSLASAPPDVLDVGAAFLLTLPLVKLPADLSGPCRLGVEMSRGGRRVRGHRLGMAGATAHVENGRVVSVDLELDPWPESWATGGPIGWLDTLVDPSAERVDVGGGARLAEALIEGLHRELFGNVTGGDEDALNR
jgi:DNA-binding HxlR family transcriptional regulator